MAKTVCPNPACPGENGDGLVAIKPTGKPVDPDKGTAQWWEVVPHWNDGTRCPGSGKKV